MTRFLPRTVLAGLAGVVLFLPLGAPLPGSCLRSVGVAGAAPSPSCGGDLRECLRAAADMHPTTFGVRYVTAEDVARCMEGFRSCTSGAASGGGNPVPSKSTAPGSDDRKGLPQRFRITENESDTESDCRRNGNALTCTGSLLTPYGATEAYKFTFTGSLSGLTATGTFSGQQTNVAAGCRSEQNLAGSATYVFGLDGTVAMRQEAPQIEVTKPCWGPATSFTGNAWESTGTWSPIK